MGGRRCEECGALLSSTGDVNTCEGLFHTALAMEWTNPPHTYRAHHLLVATYVLQHPSQLTPEAEREYRSGLVAIIDKQLQADDLRELNRGRFERRRRSWKVRPAEPRPVVSREWSATIADVVSGPAEELPERVWRWAKAVRRDLDR